MRYVLLTIVLLLSGCGPNVVKKDYKFDQFDGRHGAVILSITNNNAGIYRGGNSFAPTITISSMDTGEEFDVDGHVGTVWEKHILNSSGHSIGRVVAIELEAGLYKITDFNTSTYTTLYRAKDKPDIRFSVSQGCTSYIGNVNFYLDESTSKYRVTVNDKSDRDLLHAREKWPNLRNDHISIEIAEDYK